MKTFWKYFFLTIANLLAAINFNLLAKPINLVSGGSPGVSLVLNQVFGLSTSDIILIIYVITFLLSIFFLDKKTLIGVIYASIIYPIFVYLTEDITAIISFNYQDVLLITIIAACFSGISNGMIYKNGFASSGIGVIAPILNKYFKVSISVSNFVINTIIVLFGGYYFGFNVILLAIVYLYVSNYICNRIILGVSQNKVLFIHSDKLEDIVTLIDTKYHLPITLLNEINDEKMMVVVVKNSQYLSLKNDLLFIDNHLFYTTNNCYEVKNRVS